MTHRSPARGGARARDRARMGWAHNQRRMDHLAAQIEASVGIVLLRPYGLNGPKTQQLRDRTRAADCRYVVVKNTLARHVLARLAPPLSERLRGPSALLLLCGDPIRGWIEFRRYLADEFPRKLKRKTSETSVQKGMDPNAPYRDGFRANPNELEVEALWLDGALVDEAQLARLEAFGDRAGLRTAVVSQLLGPPRRLLAQLCSPAQQLLGVLRAKADLTGDSESSSRGV